MEHEVWIVIDPCGDVEVLSGPPRWNLKGFYVFRANVNGGDSSLESGSRPDWECKFPERDLIMSEDGEEYKKEQGYDF